MKYFIYTILVILSIIINGCCITPAIKNNDVHIEKVFVKIANIPTSLNPKAKFQGSCCIGLQIEYSGTLPENSIRSIGIQTEFESYSFPIDNSNIDYTKKIIGIKNSAEYSKRTPYDNHSIFIGKANIYIEFTDGGIINYLYIIPPPGNSTVQNNYHYVFTEEFNQDDNKGMNSISCIKAPNITNYKVVDKQLYIKFADADFRFSNGEILFYDQDYSTIGRTEAFISKNKKINRIINSGEKIYNDGTENIVRIDLNDIKFVNKEIPSGFIVSISDNDPTDRKTSNCCYTTWSKACNF